MKLFIFYYLNGVSSHYHDGGGVVVVAENIEQVRAELAQLPGVEDVWSITEDRADAIYELKGKPDIRTFVFPDAGCC